MRLYPIRAKALLWAGVILAAGLLAACSSSDRSLDDTTGPAVAAPPPAVPAGPLKAGDIMRILSGKTFRYTRPINRTGTTTFLPRGTRTECQPFAQTAEGSYSAGSATFQAM
jgi:hypothetical protein